MTLLALLLAESNTLNVVLVGVGLLVLLLLALLLFKYFNLWIQCITTGARIGFIDLVAMSLRKINPRVIVQSKIAGIQAGLQIETRDLEAHYLAGGHVVKVVRALIAADRANLPLDFRVATGIDLAGRDLLEAVQMYVKPQVAPTWPSWSAAPRRRRSSRAWARAS
jgi:uncharacterized protein YqfA (UPF0365 family)